MTWRALFISPCFAGRVAHFAKDQTSASGAHFMSAEVAESAGYDLLIAADGVNSAVRALLERKAGVGAAAGTGAVAGAGAGAAEDETDEMDTDSFISVASKTNEMLFKTVKLPVGPGRCCSPRHRHAFDPPVLERNRISGRDLGNDACHVIQRTSNPGPLD
jgi:hypothetical protein